MVVGGTDELLLMSLPLLVAVGKDGDFSGCDVCRGVVGDGREGEWMGWEG